MAGGCGMTAPLAADSRCSAIPLSTRVAGVARPTWSPAFGHADEEDIWHPAAVDADTISTWFEAYMQLFPEVVNGSADPARLVECFDPPIWFVTADAAQVLPDGDSVTRVLIEPLLEAFKAANYARTVAERIDVHVVNSKGAVVDAILDRRSTSGATIGRTRGLYLLVRREARWRINALLVGAVTEP